MVDNETTIALLDAYQALLRVPVTHPFRVENQKAYAELVAAISAATGFTRESVQTTCEQIHYMRIIGR